MSKSDVSHEGLDGSCFGGLIQGLVGVVVFLGVEDFLKVSVSPTSLKNFFVPTVNLSSVEGYGLFGFGRAFLVSVLLSEDIFGNHHPSAFAG